MKILLLNQDWFAEDLRAQGHEVVTVGTRDHMNLIVHMPLEPLTELIARLPDGFVPDRIVAFDESAPLLVTGIEDSEIPCVFYSVDTHHHLGVHRYTAHLFDCTFFAQKDYLSRIGAEELNAGWLPLWASRHMEPQEPKEYGAVFVGTMNPQLNPERVHFFNELQKRVPVLVTTGDFGEIFPRSEIVINQTVKGDLNFRVFEVMMSGALLLTEESDNGLTELFTPGRHMVTYQKNNVDDAAAKLQHYLSHPEERLRIAQQGREEILRAHCRRHRAQQLLEILQSLDKREKKWRYYAALPNLVWACNILSKVSDQYAALVWEKCLQYIHKGLRFDPPPDEELACFAAAACIEFDKIFGTDLGARFLIALCAHAPEIPILQLSRIWVLLQRGQQEAAAALARALSRKPLEVVFKEADRVVTNLLQTNRAVKPAQNTAPVDG